MRTICIALIMSLSIIAPLPMLAADKPPPDVAMYLLNSQRKYLLRLEQDFSVKIDISMNSGIRRGQVQMSVPEQVK